MQTTSHFVWIELKSELFSNLYINLYNYLKDNNIEDIISFQNILSLHITLYYFDNILPLEQENKIKKYIKNIFCNFDIFTNNFKYFEKNNNKKILYFYWKTTVSLKEIRNSFHDSFNMENVVDNKLEFIPHITFLRILNPDLFELHRKKIEIIINNELLKLNKINISNKNIYLYKVNSNFPWQIQIKL